MARHVFQYDAWDPPIGLFIGDPTKLPPLTSEVNDQRPTRADQAGLAWIDNGHRLTGTVDNSGIILQILSFIPLY